MITTTTHSDVTFYNELKNKNQDNTKSESSHIVLGYCKQRGIYTALRLHNHLYVSFA